LLQYRALVCFLFGIFLAFFTSVSLVPLIIFITLEVGLTTFSSQYKQETVRSLANEMVANQSTNGEGSVLELVLHGFLPQIPRHLWRQGISVVSTSFKWWVKVQLIIDDLCCFLCGYIMTTTLLR